VTTRGENFLTWPQRALFDRIGIRRQVLETDPYGNFLITGYDYGTAGNWGHMRGEGPARRATNTALGLVIEAIGAKVAQPRDD